MSSFWNCQSIISFTYAIGYISRGYHVIESDFKCFSAANYENELGEVTNKTNKELEEYFHYIIFSQQLHYPPSNWDNAKVIIERIIEQSTQINF